MSAKRKANTTSHSHDVVSAICRAIDSSCSRRIIYIAELSDRELKIKQYVPSDTYGVQHSIRANQMRMMNWMSHLSPNQRVQSVVPPALATKNFVSSMRRVWFIHQTLSRRWPVWRILIYPLDFKWPGENANTALSFDDRRCFTCGMRNN